MGEFLGIMLSIIFFVTPKDAERVQIWPYAGDTNQQTKELSLTFRRTDSRDAAGCRSARRRIASAWGEETKCGECDEPAHAHERR